MMEQYEQMSIFDLLPQTIQPGDFVESHGADICHVMRPGYIGSMVLYDCSTQSRTCYRAGILEKYIWNRDGCWRSIIFIGKHQRALIDHRWGNTIYELATAPDFYERSRAVREAVT